MLSKPQFFSKACATRDAFALHCVHNNDDNGDDDDNGNKDDGDDEAWRVAPAA